MKRQVFEREQDALKEARRIMRRREKHSYALVYRLQKTFQDMAPHCQTSMGAPAIVSNQGGTPAAWPDGAE